MNSSTQSTVSSDVLDEMISYYRNRAAEYDQWWNRQGRYDRGPDATRRWNSERAVLYYVFDAMALSGNVLELAPGTGTWTRRIAVTADKITAVDASAEMLAINRKNVHSAKVDYIQADLFSWQPTTTYDAVVFGFWISHVPQERLAPFLRGVASALRPGGRVFFVDGLVEPTSTAADHILPGKNDQIMTRKLNDGRNYRIVKKYYASDALESACQAAGLAVKIHTTGTYFYYGIGTRLGAGA